MSQVDLTDILFLDIETVRARRTYEEVDARLKESWEKKAATLNRSPELDEEEFYLDRAGIYAEFGKVIVIGMGFFHHQGDELQFRLKYIASDDEAEVLSEFSRVLARFDQEKLKLCAHNGKQFDFPFISRRMIIHGMPLPQALRIAGKKPWEINHLDTMELWRFGDFRHYVSLELLATLFNIESSKTKIDGSQVGEKYWEENDLHAIAEYCLRDVEVAARVYLNLTGQGDTEFLTLQLTDIKPDQSDE